MAGKQVYQNTFTSGKKIAHQVDLSNQKTGVYFVNLKSGKKSILTQKLIRN
jgi:hypothetical protein